MVKVFKKATLNEKISSTWKCIVDIKGNIIGATITCPEGHYGLLSDHRIKDDGTVESLVVCSWCDFHEFIKLEDWKKES